MLIPIGVEGHPLRRIPWVSITIAGLCVVLFAVTWVIPADPLGAEGFNDFHEYWAQHRNVELPDEVKQSLPPESLKRWRAEHDQAVKELGPPTAEDQQTFEAKYQASTQDRQTLLRRLALIPGRGPGQIGWLTYMFLHLGWMHLIGNFLFFYLTGLLLEDVWGRPLFATFYLVGGLAAAVAYYASDPHSAAVMVGASGAIAACMGAFAYRFATTRVRIGYFFFIGFRPLRGSFMVPAWLASGAWGAWELTKLLFGGEQGVALAAHVGGFVFGLGAAVAIRAAKLEQKFVEPGIEDSATAWQRPAELEDALRAFEARDWATARRKAGEALKAAPGDMETELLLYRIDAAQGLTGAAAGRLDRIVTRQLESGSRDALFVLLTDEAQKIPVEALRPATAHRMADALEGYEGVTSQQLDSLYAVAAKALGGDWMRARVRRAELALDEGQPAAARELLQGVVAGELSPEWSARLETVERRLAAPQPFAPGLSSSFTPSLSRGDAIELSGTASPPPRIVSGTVVGVTEQALRVQNASGQVSSLSWQRIVAVAAALTPVEIPGGAPRLMPVTDLVLSWGSAEHGAQVLRLSASGLALPTLYPGISPKDAWAQWLKDAVARSGATVLPDADAIARGEYPRYASAEAMTDALYGAASLDL